MGAAKICCAPSGLATTASELNSASDDLGKSISALDDSLRKLNLGIPS